MYMYMYMYMYMCMCMCMCICMCMCLYILKQTQLFDTILIYMTFTMLIMPTKRRRRCMYVFTEICLNLNEELISSSVLCAFTSNCVSEMCHMNFHLRYSSYIFNIADPPSVNCEALRWVSMPHCFSEQLSASILRHWPSYLSQKMSKVRPRLLYVFYPLKHSR